MTHDGQIANSNMESRLIGERLELPIRINHRPLTLNQISQLEPRAQQFELARRKKYKDLWRKNRAEARLLSHGVVTQALTSKPQARAQNEIRDKI